MTSPDGWRAATRRRNAVTSWSGTHCWPSSDPDRSSRRPPDRVERIVRSGLRQAQKTLVSRISGRLSAEVRARLLALVSADEGDGDSEADLGLLALIKAATGNVSLASMLTEVSRLEAVRAIGLPDGLFADVAPKVVALAFAAAASSRWTAAVLPRQNATRCLISPVTWKRSRGLRSRPSPPRA